MKIAGLAFAAACLALCGAAHAGVSFSSTFDGVGSTPAPWNWSSATGTVFGTGAMTVPAGPSAGANYVRWNVTPNTTDGTGQLDISFDVDLSHMAFDGYYNGPAIAVVGTVNGNKNPLGGGMVAAVVLNNWKAAPGATGQYRFGVGSSINFGGGGGPNRGPLFQPAAGQSPLYHCDLLIDISRVGDTWTVANTLDVTGPSGGSIVNQQDNASTTQTTSGFHGLNDITYYALGALNTYNTIDNTSMVFDNFNAAPPAVPEPASLGLLALGGLALLRRRR